MCLSSESVSGNGTGCNLEKFGQEFSCLPETLLLHYACVFCCVLVGCILITKNRPQSIGDRFDGAPIRVTRRIIYPRSSPAKKASTSREDHMECNEPLNCLEYLGSLVSVELNRTDTESKLQSMLEAVFRKTVLKHGS